MHNNQLCKWTMTYTITRLDAIDFTVNAKNKINPSFWLWGECGDVLLPEWVHLTFIQASQPGRPSRALHCITKTCNFILKLCKLLAWIKPSEQKLSPMEKFIEIVDTFFFNLRSTSPNLIALGIAMAGWNFMHLRCTDQGMMDLQVWTIRSGGASVYLEALGKQRSTLETQLWSADDNPTSAFTSLFTIANDKWINLSFRTRHSLQNNVGWELGWIRGGLRQLRSVLWWDKTSPKESS